MYLSSFRRKVSIERGVFYPPHGGVFYPPLLISVFFGAVGNYSAQFMRLQVSRELHIKERVTAFEP